MGIACWAFLQGPLFPWSPIKLGYNHLRLARADVYYPQGSAPDPAYKQLDNLIAEAESFHQLPVHKRICVISVRSWRHFAGFVPWIRGRTVGAVTLDTGTVIFVTPKIAERHFDLAEFLRHELSHAVLHQNTTLWAGRGLNKQEWFFEGLAVLFGRQKSYLTDREFLDRATKEDLVPVIDPSARAHTFDIRFGYVAWRYFLQYLMDTRGRATFQRFLIADIHEPAGWAEFFSRSFGLSLRAAISDFQRDICSGRWQLDRIEQARR